MLVSEISNLSDEDLRAQLTSRGVDVGPITGTTRKLYQRKLVRLVAGDDADAILDQDPSLSCPTFECTPDSLNDSSLEGRSTSTIRSRQAQLSSALHQNSAGQLTPEDANPPISASFKRQPINSPFPATDLQFRNSPTSNGMTDHYLKFACFAIVVTIIMYFVTQNPGNAVDLRSQNK